MKFILLAGILLWFFMSSTEVKPILSMSDQEATDLIDYYIDENKKKHAAKVAKASEKTSEENSTNNSIRVSY